jgi:hypothetical protein
MTMRPPSHRSPHPAARWTGPLLAALLLTLAAPADLTPAKPAAGRAAAARLPVAGRVRPPAVAGQFYPDDPAKLDAAVRAFLADAVPARGEPPIALVVPHAGYVFSGQIAADGWRQASGRAYDLIVLLGTNHTTAGFSGASVFTGAGFRVPNGTAVVDTAAMTALLAAGGDVNADPRVHEREHSIEVQVPFALVALPGVRILPVVVGTDDPQACIRIGRALAAVLRGRRPLIVASSDLAHYPDYGVALASDRALLAAMARLDPAGVHAAARGMMDAGLPGLETCACGEGAVMVAMEAARLLGARRGTVVSRANSGDTPLGDRARVVGYGAVMLSAGAPGADTAALAPPAPGAPSDTLGPGDRRALLALARRTLERWFATATLPLPRGFSPAATRMQGAFVTLTERGELRGCIGHMAEDRPLDLNVESMALSAALDDPRFPPLEALELERVTIEVSALTPLERVAGPAAVVIGRDGVQIRKDGRVAVFLPQVPVEQGWDLPALMENLCEKAGLPAGAWKSGAEFWTFRSVHFREGARP